MDSLKNEVNVKEKIYKLVSRHQPIGWYRLEILLPVQRKDFKQGYTLMTYLDEMVADGTIKLLADGKYSLE